MNEPTDQQLRDNLRKIDQQRKNILTGDRLFIDSVCRDYRGPLSDKQRHRALRIIGLYIMEDDHAS